MPFFSPPTHEEPIRTTVRPLNYFRLTYAMSIVRIDGTYRRIRSPAPEVLDGLQEGVDWFRGGYVYEVTNEVASALIDSGYELTNPATPNGPSGYGQGLYGYGRYGS